MVVIMVTLAMLSNLHCIYYRCKYQGLYPPVLRTEEDFDIAALYHLPADIPYLRSLVYLSVRSNTILSSKECLHPPFREYREL